MHLISHRGLDNHEFSENSLNAITNVLKKEYIEGIEIDVRITKDKEIVLIHDPVIDLISNGSGIVKYMNLKELQKYQYGKSKEPLATLNEVLNSINTNKKILIELKEFGNDYIPLVDETIKIINKYNLDIYITSFNYKLLNYIKSKYKNIRCGLIIGYGLNSLKINNNFDFNIISYYYHNKINNSKLTFVFNITKKVSLNNNFYLISDTSYKFKS